MISKICETRQIFTLKICPISGPENKSDLRKLWDSGQICADRYLVHFDHFIIMGFQQSQQIEGLFIIGFYSFQVQNANFMRKPKDCESPDFSERKNILGTAPRGMVKNIST